MQTAHHTTTAHSAGEGVPKAIMTVRSRFWPVFKTATAVWPLMHLYVQLYLPVDTRVLGFNVCGLGWNTYLSWSLSQATLTAPAVGRHTFSKIC